MENMGLKSVVGLALTKLNGITSEVYERLNKIHRMEKYGHKIDWQVGANNTLIRRVQRVLDIAEQMNKLMGVHGVKFVYVAGTDVNDSKWVAEGC